MATYKITFINGEVVHHHGRFKADLDDIRKGKIKFYEFEGTLYNVDHIFSIEIVG
ncbi:MULTISPECIES: hypothetical protein [Bacillus amyloliquefaciens group]|uniref:hypothetical protein n=1 Tax=Bacillus amyloliquefaciens group TaxID=1938374 RepID=UPI000A943488|nr:hypothetical protein [Bacillus amyloliquefaciens]